jgi:hypothetical protein
MSSKALSSALVLGVLVLGVVQVAGAQPTWNEDFEFLRGDATPGDRFGESVAASGDTVVFGAPDADAAEPQDGAAYVYVSDGLGGWTLQQKLTTADLNAREFGRAVAIDGDTIAVGDTFADSQHGAVYVFTRSGTTWTQQAKLSASDAAVGDPGADSFGTSVAVSGNTLITGATGAEVGTLNSAGAAYVYTRSGSIWTEQQKIAHPTPTANGFFPNDVDLSGERAVLGVSNHAPGGAAFVYERSGGVFAQVATIAPAGLVAGDLFGNRLALQGDRLLAGAPGDNQAGNDAGAVYVVEYDGASWVQRAKLFSSVPIPGDNFGTLALDGDLAAISSSASDVFELNAGIATLFVRESDGDWITLATLISSDAQAHWSFGSGLAIAGGSVFVGARYTTPRPPAPQVFVPGSGYEFVVGELDFEAPDFDIPAVQLVEATSSAGATAEFTITATDNVDGEIAADCAPPSGSVFPLGDTTVNCSATDAAGNTGSASFIVRVRDTTAPDAECSDVVIECTGPSMAVETSCTATDAVDPDPETTSTAQASYGPSTIPDSYTCSAEDFAGNTGSEECTVHVTDTVAPTCVPPPDAFIECTDPGGIAYADDRVQEHLEQFEYSDLCGFIGVVVDTPGFLPTGCAAGQASTITETVDDGSGNETSCSTDIIVFDNRAPAITAPAPITLECDTHGGVAFDNGNITSWLAIASVFDRCHDAALTHNAPALFGVGQTVVAFRGEDTCGNFDFNVSNVTVVDNGAPTATCQNTSVECTGALTPVTTTCGGSDLCDASVAVASDAAASYARGQHTFSCQAQDDSGNGDSASCLINVVDTTAAVIAPIATATAPVAPGTNVAMSASFTAACGPHTGTWNFGDGTSGPATISEGAGSGTASGSHVYNTAGTFTLTLTLTDAAGNVASRTHQSIVVSAPPATTRGSVTGAGVIASPRGALRSAPNSSGVASFTFAASHPLFGPFTPVSGVTTFSMLLPTFSFTSLSVQSLTITGPNAKYRGTGRVNGSSGFSFLMTVVDGQRPGGGGFDRLHLKVWSTGSGAVVYDNEPTVPDTANATARITAGTIAILPF